MPPLLDLNSGYEFNDTFNFVGNNSLASTYARDNQWQVLLDQRVSKVFHQDLTKLSTTSRDVEWTDSFVVPLKKWQCQLDMSLTDPTISEYLSGSIGVFVKGYICAFMVADDAALSGSPAVWPWTFGWGHEIKYRDL